MDDKYKIFTVDAVVRLQYPVNVKARNEREAKEAFGVAGADTIVDNISYADQDVIIGSISESNEPLENADIDAQKVLVKKPKIYDAVVRAVLNFPVTVKAMSSEDAIKHIEDKVSVDDIAIEYIKNHSFDDFDVIECCEGDQEFFDVDYDLT